MKECSMRKVREAATQVVDVVIKCGVSKEEYSILLKMICDIENIEVTDDEVAVIVNDAFDKGGVR